MDKLLLRKHSYFSYGIEYWLSIFVMVNQRLKTLGLFIIFFLNTLIIEIEQLNKYSIYFGVFFGGFLWNFFNWRSTLCHYY
jgi:hypothetical protein